MVKEVKIKNTLNSVKVMNKLWTEFPHWSIRNMGEKKSLPASTHYHIKSKKKNETGTIEITLSAEKRDRVLLKIAKNRKGNWAQKARKDLIKFIK